MANDIWGTQMNLNMDNRNLDRAVLDKMQTEQHQDWRTTINPYAQPAKQATVPDRNPKPPQAPNQTSSPKLHSFNDHYEGSHDRHVDTNQKMMADWAAARRLMA
jgi:hypothetical protein